MTGWSPGLSDRYRAVLLGFGALLAWGCGLVAVDSPGDNSNKQSGGTNSLGSAGSNASAGGGNASGGSGLS